jgi:hypothetical protein
VLLTGSAVILSSRGVFLIDIISPLPVLLFNPCCTFNDNRKIVTYVKRVAMPQIRALRMRDIATVLKIEPVLSRVEGHPVSPYGTP